MTIHLQDCGKCALRDLEYCLTCPKVLDIQRQQGQTEFNFEGGGGVTGGVEVVVST